MTKKPVSLITPPPPQSFLTKITLIFTITLILTLALVSCGGGGGGGNTDNGKWQATVIVKNQYSSPITRVVLSDFLDETYLDKTTSIAANGGSQSFTFSIDVQYLLQLKNKLYVGSSDFKSGQDIYIGDGETATLTLGADGKVTVNNPK